MKTEKISYKRNFLIDPHTLEHEHVGMEIVLEPGDTAEQALDVAKATIGMWYKNHVEYLHSVQHNDVPDTDWTLVKQELFRLEFKEEAMNFLKIQGLGYIKELNEIASHKPLKHN